MSTFATIAIADIATPERLRSLDDDWVQAIAASIQDIGLQTPVLVQAIDSREGSNTPPYRLVAGLHRLSACLYLGMTEIPSCVAEMDELTARIAEIDENLFRRELDALDRAVFLAERKAIYETLHPETKNGAQGGRGGKRNENETISFSKDAAEKTGFSTRTIDFAVKIGADIPPHIRERIRKGPLAKMVTNQSELLSLAKWDEAGQSNILDLLEAGEYRRVAEAVRKLRGRAPRKASKDESDLSRLQRAWRKATGNAQRAFVEQLKRDGYLGASADE